MKILPGQLAFFFVLSIIPLIAVLGSLITSLPITMDYIDKFIFSKLPREVEELLLPLLTGKSINLNIVLFYVTSILLASNGTHSMIIASNELYKIKYKSFANRRVKALFMTFILIFLLIFVLLVPAFGDKIMALIVSLINNDTLGNSLTLGYQLFKYPISLLTIFFAIKLLYTIAPDDKIKSRTTTYGALFTTVGWVISTRIYSIYIGSFTSYNIFYGSISNILVLLLWVYLLAFIFVLGMAFNAGLREKNMSNNSLKKEHKVI